MFSNAASATISIKSIAVLGDRMMVKSEKMGVGDPNFHDAYLPAGLFVPAYGRIMLYEQLDRLGQRALYHDTDSIIYIYDPLLYNIPESDTWGSWSVEKFDWKNGGIREFVGMGPKSYGLKAANGKSFIKVKGLSLKHAHEHLLNFDVMKRTLEVYLDSKETPSVALPQYNFAYKVGTGISTVCHFKAFMFKPEELKGQLVGRTLFPYGYEV